MAGPRWLLVTGILGLLAGAVVFGLGLKRGIREAGKTHSNTKHAMDVKTLIPEAAPLLPEQEHFQEQHQQQRNTTTRSRQEAILERKNALRKRSGDAARERRNATQLRGAQLQDLRTRASAQRRPLPVTKGARIAAPHADAAT